MTRKYTLMLRYDFLTYNSHVIAHFFPMLGEFMFIFLAIISENQFPDHSRVIYAYLRSVADIASRL